MKPVQSIRSWLIFSHVSSNRTEAGGCGATGRCWRGEHLRRRPQAAGRPLLLLVSLTPQGPQAVESQPSIRAAEDSHSPRATFNCIRRTGPILSDSIHFSRTPIRSEKSRHFLRGRRDGFSELLGASVSMGLAGSDSEVVGRAVAAVVAALPAVFVIAIEL